MLNNRIYRQKRADLSLTFPPQHCKIALSDTFSWIHFHVGQRLVLSTCTGGNGWEERQHPASRAKGFLMSTFWASTRMGSCFPSPSCLQSPNWEVHTAGHCLGVHQRMVGMVYLVKWWWNCRQWLRGIENIRFVLVYLDQLKKKHTNPPCLWPIVFFPSPESFFLIKPSSTSWGWGKMLSLTQDAAYGNKILCLGLSNLTSFQPQPLFPSLIKFCYQTYWGRNPQVHIIFFAITRIGWRSSLKRCWSWNPKQPGSPCLGFLSPSWFCLCCCTHYWTSFSFIKGQSNISTPKCNWFAVVQIGLGFAQSDTESRARDVHFFSSSVSAPCYVGNSMVCAGSCHKPRNVEDKKPGSGAPERREFPCNRANYSLHCREWTIHPLDMKVLLNLNGDQNQRAECVLPLAERRHQPYQLTPWRCIIRVWS